MKNNYLLIDVMNMVFRFYYSPVSNRAGNTIEDKIENVDLYVTSILQAILKKHRTDLYEGPKDFIPVENILLALDSKSWRYDHAEDYKGGRSYDEGDMKVIKAIVKRLAEVAPNIGMNVVKAERMEADDIIALFAMTLSEMDPKSTFIVITNDDDYTQLGHIPGFVVYNPNKEAVNQKDGKVSLNIKTLKGDGSDNIKTPLTNLTLDGEDIKVRYGEKTILQSINGRFHCTPPNTVQKEIKYHNGKMEIATICRGERTVLYSSDKTTIAFDEEYKLVREQKLKFEKGIDEDRRETITRRTGLLIDEILEYGNGVFEMHENYKEDFIANTMNSLVDKFKKEHRNFIKKMYPELKKPAEISKKSDEMWFQDLLDHNKHIIGLEKTPETVEEVVKELSDGFRKKLEHNEKMIDFKNIPQELKEHFEKNLLPKILEKKPNIDRVAYLKAQNLQKVANTLESEERKLPTQTQNR